MTDPAAMIFRMTVLEQKVDQSEEKNARHRESVDVKLNTLLAESNQWAGVRKTLAVLGSFILGVGMLTGVFLTWFFGHK